jgi:hypothetical protein
MQWRLSRIVIGALIIVVITGAGTVGAIKWLWPGAGDRRPKLVDVPPLSPVTIQDALEAAAPRDYSGSRASRRHVSNADIGWSVAHVLLRPLVEQRRGHQHGVP